MRFITLLLFFFLADMEIFASDITIFGIAIDKPMPNLQKCEQKEPTEMCLNTLDYIENPSKKAWGTYSYHIDMPYNDIPKYVKNQIDGTIGFETIDGNVERISFATCGYECQDETLNALTKKFGKVSSMQKTRVQNSFGSTYVAYDAKWKIGNISVHFTGMDSVITHGYVEIITLKYNKLYEKWEKNNKGKDL